MKNDNLADQLASIEHELIEYKAKSQTIADSTPLYRASIPFSAFSASSPTIRHYTIELLFDTTPVLIRPFVYASVSPSLPTPEMIELYSTTGLGLAKMNTIRSSQYYDSNIEFTVFSSAELRGYITNYWDEVVGQ